MVLSIEARRDLFEILSHIDAKNPPAAMKMTKEFSRKFQLIGFQPGIGTPSKNRQSRVIPLRKSYRIHYRVATAAVWITRIVHTARMWPDADLPVRSDQ